MIATQKVVILLLVLVLAAGCSPGVAKDRSATQPGTVSSPVVAPAVDTPTPRATLGLPSVTAEPSPEPTPAAVLDLSRFSPGVAQIVADLQGLPLDDFFDQSYMQLGLRSPEVITEMGIARQLGMRNDRLTDLSDAYARETQELEAGILALLRTYDRSELSAQQQISFDVYEWWLDDLVRGHQFTYNNYPVHHFLRSYQRGLVWLFTDAHPLVDRQDVEDYLSRLAQVDDQIGQLLDGLKLREQLGVIPPDFIIEWTLPELRDLAGSSARATPFYTAFADRSSRLEGISSSELQAFREAIAEEIDRSVLPALHSLASYFEHLLTIATSTAGAWKLPDGDAYYAYTLRHESSSDLTPHEVHELGLAEVARIQAEIRGVFSELGYPQDGNLSELMDRAIHEGGFYELGTPAQEQALIAAYQAILDEAQLRLEDVVDLRPQAELVIVGEPGFTGGGYYTAGARDGSRPGVFHTGVSGSMAPKFNMPTVAYHEAIPGHHFQIAIAQELDLPFFRTELFFNGYVEGWALYAERLAWELGLYENDPYGNLGRLQLELLRAVRLVVDTGIHAKRWTREEGKAYIKEALGDPSGRWVSEVERYIVLPAQATGYKIGMLKILELRQRAMDQLGERFDLRDFHRVILGSGGVPLDILEQLVQAYIDAELAGATLVPAGDGSVQGWAVLAERNEYSDVGMTDLLVNYAGTRQMQQALESAGWNPAHIRDLREFSRESLERGLDWLEASADEDDVTVLYVAAHGSYLRNVLVWDEFFAREWKQIVSQRRLLLIDSCGAAEYTSTIRGDPDPYLSVAAVDSDESAWFGLEEEGLPIIGGVFTHYFTAALGDSAADSDGDGWVSVQEAVLVAEEQQRAYMHEVVLAVPEFVKSFHQGGSAPELDPTYPDVIVEDHLPEPLYLSLDAYRQDPGAAFAPDSAGVQVEFHGVGSCWYQ